MVERTLSYLDFCGQVEAEGRHKCRTSDRRPSSSTSEGYTLADSVEISAVNLFFFFFLIYICFLKEGNCFHLWGIEVAQGG